eukprot:c34542_g1_i1 orf=2-190(-)
MDIFHLTFFPLVVGLLQKRRCVPSYVRLAAGDCSPWGRLGIGFGSPLPSITPSLVSGAPSAEA